MSVDPLDTHYRWLNQVERLAGVQVHFPIVEDPNRWISGLYEMLDPTDDARRTARSVFLVDPDDRVRFVLTYPAATGRNFEEVLRVIDSLQANTAAERGARAG